MIFFFAWFKSFGTSDSPKKKFVTYHHRCFFNDLDSPCFNTKPKSENDPPFNGDESTSVLYEPPLLISFFYKPSQTVVLYQFQFKMSTEVNFFDN